MDDPLLNWVTPAQAAAERKRKAGEPKRILGCVLLSGILSGILALAMGSWEAFLLLWLVSGVMFSSLATSEREGPGT